MKQRIVVLSLVVFLAQVGSVFCADRKPEGYWYWIGMDYSDAGRQMSYVGTVDMDEKTLAKALEGTAFILVDNLRTQDPKGTYISFTDLAPLYQSRTYINPKHVVNIVPLNPKELGR